MCGIVVIWILKKILVLLVQLKVLPVQLSVLMVVLVLVAVVLTGKDLESWQRHCRKAVV